MSILQTVLFNNAANFTLSNTQISGSVAKLGLIDNPGQVFAQSFNNDTGFTYDNSKAEFSGGVVRQKDTTQLNSLMGVKFTSSLNPNWHKSGGSLTGVGVSAPTLVGGKLVCTGTQGVYYTRPEIAVSTHRFKYTPNYTGAPPENLNILSMYNGSNSNDRFHLTHSPSGVNLRFTLYNSTGVVVIPVATTVAGWSPTAGQEYEFEVLINSVVGVVRVFVDGVLLGTNNPGAWTKGTGTTRLYLGSCPIIYGKAEGSFDDYLVFSSSQHSASYVPGYAISDSIYLASKVDLPLFPYTGIGTIQSVDASAVTETGLPKYIVGGLYWNGVSWAASNGTYAQASDIATVVLQLPNLVVTGAPAIPVSVVFTDSNSQSSVDDVSVTVTGQKYSPTGYIEPSQGLQVKELVSYSDLIVDDTNTSHGIIIKCDGNLLYWDGSGWVSSNGTIAQSNTELEVNDNLSQLNLGSNFTIFFRWVLATSANTESSEITSAQIGYDFGAIVSIASTCVVYGYLRDITGSPIVGASMEFQINLSSTNFYKEATSNIISTKPISVTTDSNGYFSLSLVRSSQFVSETSYKVAINFGGGVVVRKGSTGKLSFIVPDSDTKDITDLLPTVV